MSELSDLAKQFVKVDSLFAAAQSAAFVNGDDTAWNKAKEERDKNEQAYLLFIFSRFEAIVNSAALNLFSVRDGTGNWSESRAWGALNKDRIHDIHLMTKVELLINKQSHHYQTVKSYYKGRNEIAHGEKWEGAVIATVISDLEKISGLFTRT